MANILLSGFVRDDAGVVVNGATVDLLTRNTTTPVLATTTTNASGYWSISYATEGRYDVRITNGASIQFLSYDDQVQLTTAEVSLFRVRNPANTFKYEFVGAAITANRAVTWPLLTGDDTLVAEAMTQTLTNKRVNPRVTTEVSSATPTINTDNTDLHSITALAVAITSMTTNLSGTPVNGQKLLIRILDNATGRAITWGASFVAKGAALPSTTTASKLLTVGFIYDSVLATWGCVAAADEA